MNRRTIAAIQGATLLSLEALGRLPHRGVRTAALRRLGASIDPTATVYRWREIRGPSNVTIGPNSIIGLWATIDGRSPVEIGRNVNFSSEVALWTLQHDPQSPTFGTKGGPIVIGDRAWISFRATILPGVTIGEGAVVAAGAIVAKDVEPYTIVGGLPARPIGARSRDLTYELDGSGAYWFA
jgi:acetyltransferase-like isoleucine patch superfamily enzyme